MEKGLVNYVELFAGIGVGANAVEAIFPEAVNLFYSEIYKPSIKIYQDNFPDHFNIGDITKIPQNLEIPAIDLVIGGSPCQDLTVAGKRRGLDGEKSKLFWHYKDFVDRYKPKYFILENVASMSNQDRDTISEALGVEPVLLDSSWFGYQRRKRLYWCNFPVRIPINQDGKSCEALIRWSSSGRGRGNPRAERFIRDGKSNTLLTGSGCRGQSTKTLIDVSGNIQDLDIKTCEHLAGLPVGYTEAAEKLSHRFKGIGNAFDGWTMRYILQELRGLLLKVDSV